MPEQDLSRILEGKLAMLTEPCGVEGVRCRGDGLASELWWMCGGHTAPTCFLLAAGGTKQHSGVPPLPLVSWPWPLAFLQEAPISSVLKTWGLALPGGWGLPCSLQSLLCLPPSPALPFPTWHQFCSLYLNRQPSPSGGSVG